MKMRRIKFQSRHTKVMEKGKMKHKQFFTAKIDGEIFYGFTLNSIPDSLFPLETQLGHFNHKGVTYIRPEDKEFKYTGNKKSDVVTEEDFDYLSEKKQKDFKYQKREDEEI